MDFELNYSKPQEDIFASYEPTMNQAHHPHQLGVHGVTSGDVDMFQYISFDDQRDFTNGGLDFSIPFPSPSPNPVYPPLNFHLPSSNPIERMDTTYLVPPLTPPSASSSPLAIPTTASAPTTVPGSFVGSVFAPSSLSSSPSPMAFPPSASPLNLSTSLPNNSQLHAQFQNGHRPYTPHTISPPHLDMGLSTSSDSYASSSAEFGGAASSNDGGSPRTSPGLADYHSFPGQVNGLGLQNAFGPDGVPLNYPRRTNTATPISSRGRAGGSLVHRQPLRTNTSSSTSSQEGANAARERLPRSAKSRRRMAAFKGSEGEDEEEYAPSRYTRGSDDEDEDGFDDADGEYVPSGSGNGHTRTRSSTNAGGLYRSAVTANATSAAAAAPLPANHRSSGNPAPSSGTAPKQSRIEMEQRRRDALKGKFDMLRSVLPDNGPQKNSKVVVLSRATHHIVEMHQRIDDLRSRATRLETEVDRLRNLNEQISLSLTAPVATSIPIPANTVPRISATARGVAQQQGRF